MDKPTQLQQRRGIYLLPNLITTINLLSGFYAIIAAMDGKFTLAAIAIFVAMVMDALDGRVARLTHTQTEFGAQYDSLADIVAFGLAPALVTYSWLMTDLGKVGGSVAFFYVTTAALRLARFNIQMATVDKKYFIGLPSPASAGLIASFIALINRFEVDGMMIAILLATLTVLVSVLMISKIKFYSFKEIDFKGRVPFFAMWIMVGILVAVSLNPPLMLFIIFLAYALSGPVCALLRWYAKKHPKQIN